MGAESEERKGKAAANTQQRPFGKVGTIITQNRRSRAMADNQVDRPQGGTKDDRTFPDGVGEPSSDEPVYPSRQPIPTPKDVTRRKK